jgi:glycosyltransferase involved in cell wall biosynthesis
VFSNCHWLQEIEHKKIVKNRYVREMVSNAVALTCQSPLEKEILINMTNKKFESKIVIIPPLVSPDFVNLNKTPKNLVHTNGRYCPAKNHAMVIRASIELGLPVLVGGFIDHYDKNLFEKCSGMAGSHVEVRGQLSTKELIDIYNRTRVYVVGSMYECNSGSFNEAIACGCKILSSDDHLGVSSHSQKGMRTFRAGDENSLKEELSKIYFSEEEQENKVIYLEEGEEMWLEFYERAISNDFGNKLRYWI